VPKIIEFYWCISLLQKCYKDFVILLAQLVFFPLWDITELICKEYLTTAKKLQPVLYSRKVWEHFSEICFILS